jgi:EmrB/QacA subfamily drug resistance transporter
MSTEIRTTEIRADKPAATEPVSGSGSVTPSGPPAAPGSALATKHGRLILVLLCSVAFLDFVDASIVGVALPAIRTDLHSSVQGLQWIPSGYLLTYGGFMLLGGRAADLLGRRRILVAGTALIGIASLLGGIAGNEGLLVSARLLQGLGAAMMLPAALSILTTTFSEPADRHKALGVWGGVGGLASAAGVLLGGVLTDGFGWRWVFFVNPIACIPVLVGIYRLLPADRPARLTAKFDAVGAMLVTGAMLLLVFTLVKAPDQGWGSQRTLIEFACVVVLLVLFVANEQRSADPLLPFAIFRVRGLVAADATQLIAFAGFLAMFFFLTLYMQNVLGYSPMQTGGAYLPLCVGVGVAAGVAAQLVGRIGTRPVIVAGCLIAAGGLFYLSLIRVHGSYLADLLPGTLIVSFGLGAVFVGVATAANAGVAAEQAGLAAALLNASQQIGGALGLAILTAIATARSTHLVSAGDSLKHALTAGFQRGLLMGSLFLIAAAVIALRASNTRGAIVAATSEGN